MLSFIFVLLWQLTAGVRLFPTLGRDLDYDFIIAANEPIYRFSLTDASTEQAQNARIIGQVAMSSVNQQCIEQLLAYHQNPSAFVFPKTRMLSPAKDEKILKEEGVANILAPFDACNDVIEFLVKSAPRDISDEDYVKSSNVKLKEISSPQPALQLYVKSKFKNHYGYARMQFAIDDLEQYYAKATFEERKSKLGAARAKIMANRRRKEEERAIRTYKQEFGNIMKSDMSDTEKIEAIKQLDDVMGIEEY